MTAMLVLFETLKASLTFKRETSISQTRRKGCLCTGQSRKDYVPVAEEGANVSSRDSECTIPLTYVALNGHEKPAQLLHMYWRERTYVTSEDNDSTNPLTWAAMKEFERIVKLLLA